MNRILLAGLTSIAALALVSADRLDPDQREASVRYINDLENADGGFRPGAADRASQLGATSSSLRALKYLGGRPRDRQGPARFVQSCYDRSIGAYKDRPGGKPDVRSTAMGIMAAVELDMPLGDQQDAIVRYLADNAQSLADIYIAAAALDPAGIRPPTAQRWIAAYQGTRKPDGTYGQGAFDTAGAVITILRLGGTVEDRSAVLKTLRAAQQPDGGFAGASGKSDLAASYRVMRAFVMLKDKPDLDRLSDFVARCRNSDGGYGPMPGQPSSVSTTYFASIILHWIDELE